MGYIILFAFISYFIGSLPFGLWIGLLWKGVDIRTLGSKNIGSTNVFRVLGPGPAIVVFLLDTAKGAAGMLLAEALHPPISFPLLLVIGFCAIIGHTLSPFLKFNGGRGVATSLGMLLAANPLVALIGLASWIIIVALTRYVSLASIVAALTLPFSPLLVIHNSDHIWWMTGLGGVTAVLVIVKHIPNIQRLLAGMEPKFGQRVQVPEGENQS